MILSCIKYTLPEGRSHLVLERVSDEVLKQFHQQLGAQETCIVPCQKDLFFFTCAQSELSVDRLSRLLLETGLLAGLSKEGFQQYTAGEAAYQFLQIATGILTHSGDSRLIEHIREIYSRFAELGLVGSVFHYLFQRSIWLHEKARMETDYFQYAVRPAEVFGGLARKIFGNLDNVQIQIVGESQDVVGWLRALNREGGRHFSVVCESPSQQEVYDQFNARLLSPGRNPVLPGHVDILLLFANEPSVLESRAVSRRMARRGNAPLLIYCDTPNHPERSRLKKVYNVFFYDREDLDHIIERSRERVQKTRKTLEDWLWQETASFMQWLNSDLRYQFAGIVGTTREMQRVFELISRIAQTDITVLIQGESGTGKELVARAIHRLSKRADRPFVVVNCGAIPETLLESELFGHVRGAFTGAIAQKQGLFEEAHQGTIFLDEVAELTPPLQVRLLRFLQEGEIRRVGSNETIRLDVRVLAATNKNLQELVERQQIRSDLFYRLNVIQIQLPPLRERREDIPILAMHFVRKFAGALQKRVDGIAPEAMDLLCRYEWPGNVRELENAIEHAVALTVNSVIQARDLPGHLQKQSARDGQLPKRRTLKEIEQHYIREVLEECGWNYDLAARILGIGRTTLWRKIREYRLRDDL